MSVAVLKGHQRGRTTAKLSAVLHVGRAVERLIWLNRAKRPCDILGGGMALWCGTFNAYSQLSSGSSGAKLWLTLCGCCGCCG